jgi:hypothetical protein
LKESIALVASQGVAATVAMGDWNLRMTAIDDTLQGMGGFGRLSLFGNSKDCVVSTVPLKGSTKVVMSTSQQDNVRRAVWVRVLEDTPQTSPCAVVVAPPGIPELEWTKCTARAQVLRSRLLLDRQQKLEEQLRQMDEEARLQQEERESRKQNQQGELELRQRLRQRMMARMEHAEKRRRKEEYECCEEEQRREEEGRRR